MAWEVLIIMHGEALGRSKGCSYSRERNQCISNKTRSERSDNVAKWVGRSRTRTRGSVGGLNGVKPLGRHFERLINANIWLACLCGLAQKRETYNRTIKLLLNSNLQISEQAD